MTTEDPQNALASQIADLLGLLTPNIAVQCDVYTNELVVVLQLILITTVLLESILQVHPARQRRLSRSTLDLSRRARCANPTTEANKDRRSAFECGGARSRIFRYRAISIAALDKETFLLPVKRQIEKHNAETMFRMLASTNDTEVRPGAVDAGAHKYISPFCNIRRSIASQAAVSLDTIEYIPPFISQPWRRGPKIYIDNTEDARSRHDTELTKESTICIYTDGSGIDGHVGAAAVYLQANRTESAYMGTKAVSTVYGAELQGIILALKIAQDIADNGAKSRRRIAIWTDNQAAIRLLTRAEGRSGAYILKHIARQIDMLQSQGRTVTVRWIPSHEGIDGNEAADMATREATGWREGQDESNESNRGQPLIELHPAKATLKRHSRRDVNKKWQIS